MEDFEIEFKIDSLREMEKCFQDLNEIISGLDAIDIGDKKINEIFRIVHTLKGNSKASDFEYLTKIAHLFEDLLIKVRDGNRSYDEEIHSITLDFCDRVTEAIEFTISDLSHVPNFSNLEKSILARFSENTQGAIPTAARADVKVEKFATYKALIIDDDPSIQSLLSSYLKDLNRIEVISAENGRDALLRTNKIKFDVIICDYQMPELNGSDYIEIVRYSSNVNSETPIIFLSKYHPDLSADSDTWRDVFFVEKPVDKKKFRYYFKICLNISEK